MTSNGRSNMWRSRQRLPHIRLLGLCALPAALVLGSTAIAGGAPADASKTVAAKTMASKTVASKTAAAARVFPPLPKVDVNARSLMGQPYMHVVAARVGPDGQVQTFCVDASKADLAAQLRLHAASFNSATRIK